MRYILDERYRFRGWKGASTGLYDTWKKNALFFDKEKYIMLLECNGAHEVNPKEFSKSRSCRSCYIYIKFCAQMGLYK